MFAKKQLFTARKSPQNSSLLLGFTIPILRKMPTKPDKSSVECYGHDFLIAALVSGSHDMRQGRRVGYLLREISKYTADVI